MVGWPDRAPPYLPILTVFAKPAHMGSGFQHQAGAGPPRCSGLAAPWLACPYGGGGTHHKVLLSQQIASGSAITTTNLRGEDAAAVVMPPQAHRESITGQVGVRDIKQNKTNTESCKGENKTTQILQSFFQKKGQARTGQRARTKSALLFWAQGDRSIILRRRVFKRSTIF